MEVRLNPLFNRSAIIKNLDSNFPREKREHTFFCIVRAGYIKINSIDFSENGSSYVIDWEAIVIKEKVEEIK